MNIEMSDLYVKAVVATRDYHQDNPDCTQVELNQYCAKIYGESIVRECLNQLQDLDTLKPPSVTENLQELINISQTAILEVGAAKIKHYFGIEQ